MAGQGIFLCPAIFCFIKYAAPGQTESHKKK